MRNKLPEDHHIIASALPDMRAHFEEATRRNPDHSFVLGSIADELRSAEMLLAHQGHNGLHIERVRFNLIAAAEGAHYYPMVAHEFDAALDIALAHGEQHAAQEKKRSIPRL